VKNKQQKADLQNVFQGFHNSNLDAARSRLSKSRSYQDLSTIWITPVPSDPPMVSARIVFQSWMNLMTPMNQPVFRLPVFGLEVGAAYNFAIEQILANPQLARFKYLLTIEHDNMPPADGLIKLYESMSAYDGVSGLYWTKGEAGQPMIYGDVNVHPRNYVPQMPLPDTVQPCNGIGMGFALFKMDMFKKMPRPWFRTLQEYDQSVGAKAATQDLYFCSEAAKYGYKFAVDTRVKVGHMDIKEGTIW
jgi:hypothetical protein